MALTVHGRDMHRQRDLLPCVIISCRRCAKGGAFFFFGGRYHTKVLSHVSGQDMFLTGRGIRH